MIKQSTSLLGTLTDERDKCITAKTNFNTQYEILSKYFLQLKTNSSQLNTDAIQFQGEFLNDGSINDNVGAKAARGMASAILGAVWKNESSTFRIVPSRHIPITEEIKRYFTSRNAVLTSSMEKKKGKLELSLSMAILEWIIYGTSSIVTQQGDYETPLRYSQKSVLNFCLSFDGEGYVDTIILDYALSAQELYEAYGEKAGPNVAAAYRSEDHISRYILSETIKPRKTKSAKKGRLAMPIASYKYLPNEDIFLEEGGYTSFPMSILFYSKLEFENYGRSPAMDALPTVMQANQAAEILGVGGEATALPPMGMYDNGSLAGKTVDFTAAALNVFNVAGTVPTEKPVFPLYTVGDLRVMFEWWKLLHEQVAEYFMLDRLYGIDNTQRKTLGEAAMWNNIRNDSLALCYSMCFKFLTEIIERSVEILYGMGLMGVKNPDNPNDTLVVALKKNGHDVVRIPAEIQKAIDAGLDWYDIQFISPAATSMRSDELQGTLMFAKVMTELSVISPEFIDVLEPIGTADKLKKLLSADLMILRTPEQMQERAEMRARMQQQQMEMEARAVQAKANQSNAQAEAARSGAIRTMQGVGLNEQ